MSSCVSAGLLEELLERALLRELRLLLELVDLLLDLGVGDLDVHLLGLALEPLDRGQQLQRLVAQRLVLLLALRLELGVADLGLALGGLGLLLAQLRRRRPCSPAAWEPPRRAGRSTWRATVIQWSKSAFSIGFAVDLRDGVAGDAAARREQQAGHGEGEEGKEDSRCRVTAVGG